MLQILFLEKIGSDNECCESDQHFPKGVIFRCHIFRQEKNENIVWAQPFLCVV